MTLSAMPEGFMANRVVLAALFPDHFELMGKPMQRQIGGTWELEPRWDRYAHAERTGVLLCMILRDRGQIVGYWVQLMDTGFHYAKLYGSALDMWYLKPEYREGAAPLVLGRAVKKELQARGLQLFMAGEKLHRPCGRLYAALGMVPVEQHWAMWLGKSNDREPQV